MRKMIIPAVIGYFLLSCSPKINSEQANRLDALEAGVDSAVNILVQEIDSSAAMELANNYFRDREFFLEKMKDTLDTKTIFLIDKYMSYKKAMRYLQSNYHSYLKEALIMQQQMKDLRHDVEKRMVDEEYFEKYYELEHANYKQLQKAAQQIGTIYQKSSTEIAEIKPRIDSIITAYKSKIVE